MRLLGQTRKHGINADHLGAALDGIGNACSPMPHVIGPAVDDTVSPPDDTFGLLKIAVDREPGRRGHLPGGYRDGRHSGLRQTEVADPHAVGGTDDHVKKLLERHVVINPARPPEITDIFPAILLHGLLELLHNRLHGFIPGDSLPFSLPSLSCSFVGIFNAIGVVYILYGGITLFTYRSSVERAIGIPFHEDKFSILHMAQKDTAAVTQIAGCFDDFLSATLAYLF